MAGDSTSTERRTEGLIAFDGLQKVVLGQGHGIGDGALQVGNLTGAGRGRRLFLTQGFEVGTDQADGEVLPIASSSTPASGIARV